MKLRYIAVALVALLFSAGVRADDVALKTADLSVQGMTCDHCSSAITKKLKTMPGVVSSTVQHTNGTAKVSYDATKISEADIIKAIEKMGFKAGPASTPAP